MNRRSGREGAVIHRLAIAAAVAALGACTTTKVITKDQAGADGGDSPGEPHGAAANVSGTRLKPRSLSAEDGARHFAGWYDSERETECTFQRASDGKLRCLPASLTVNPAWYSDSACSKRLAYAFKGCSAQTTASLQESYCAGSTGSNVTVYAVGGPYTGHAYYTKSANGECTGAEVAGLGGTYELFSVGKEIAPSDFVAATESIE